MSKSVPVSVPATSLFLEHLSTKEKLAVIDVEVIRETEKAVMVILQDHDEPTSESQWLPKKALTHKSIMGQEVYVVSEWFETMDNVCIDKLHEELGYTTDRG